jgi:D-3-phosphoglycerate dehydrogenase
MNDLHQARVLVTPTSYAKDDPSLRTDLEAEVGEVVYNTLGRPLTSVELVQTIRGFDGYIAGLDSIDRTVIEAADRLKVIARYGVGVDNVDMEAARARGIIVTNTPEANSESVAELTIGLMLALARNIINAAQATKSGAWPRLGGVMLSGKVVGLYGLGSIGKRVACLLTGFGCSLLAFDLAPDTGFAQKMGIRIVMKDELIRLSDFLSLHLPLSPETQGLVDLDFLSQMKSGAFLINTSRGELINETALLEALQEGHLRGAALDVFTHQPPSPDHPLLALPQVIATPHMGSHTDGATNAMGWGALNDCLAVLRGENPCHRVV